MYRKFGAMVLLCILIAACGSSTPTQPPPTYQYFDVVAAVSVEGGNPNLEQYRNSRESIDISNVPGMLKAFANVALDLSGDRSVEPGIGELVDGGDAMVIYFRPDNHWWTITIWHDAPELHRVGRDARVGTFATEDFEAEYVKGMWMSHHPKLLEWNWDSKQEHYVIRWQEHDLYFEFDSMCEAERDKSVCVSLADLQMYVAGLVVADD